MKMWPMFGWGALVYACLLSVAFFILRRRNRLPPGPKPLPLVGNVFDVPAKYPWLAFTQWKKSFGDIIHIDVLGKHIIVLNSLDAITDLLDRRRATYSDRPKYHIAGDLMGAGETIAFLQCNETWRNCRKLFRHAFNKQATTSFRQQQAHATNLYLNSLLHNPQAFIPELRLTIARVILSVTYGFSQVSSADEYVTLAEYVLDEVSRATLPGSCVVDFLPTLKLLPSWFPGAGFKRQAANVRSQVLRMVELPFQQVKLDMALGISNPCFVANLLQNMDNSIENQSNIKWSAGTMYGAGVETTFATILTFISLILQYQDTQKHAQAEIDRVLCTDRLPNFDDLPSLPYCDALLKETIRYCSPVPLGLPHRCSEDDTYKGYNIPKGSTIIPNVWAITRDSALYEDPERFWPERFLDKENQPLDPMSYAFGFGSRSCPGVSLATDSLRIVTVSILAAFNVSHPRDEDGKDIVREIELSPTLIILPEPFLCRIEPRPRYLDLLRSEEIDGTRVH